MKALKRILILTAVTGGIVAFWLVPLINTAEETTYVRRYENTDLVMASVDKEMPASNEGEKREKKKEKKQEQQQKRQARQDAKQMKQYNKEVIRSRDKLSKITPKMYSRSAQFIEQIAIDTVQEEVEIDTTASM